MTRSASPRASPRRWAAPTRRFELAPHALNDLDRIVGSLEEPLSDSAVLPLWHLCAGTGAHVKVALSGEGGDEALGGYGRYFWAGVADQLEPLGDRLADVVSRLADLVPARTLGPLNFIRRAGKLAHSIDLSPEHRYLSWFEIFTPAEQRALVRQEATEPTRAPWSGSSTARRTWRSTTSSGCSTSTFTPCCSTTC